MVHVITAVVAVAVVAVAYAIYKHVTLAQLKADISAEITKLRASNLAINTAAEYEKVVAAIEKKLCGIEKEWHG